MFNNMKSTQYILKIGVTILMLVIINACSSTKSGASYSQREDNSAESKPTSSSEKVEQGVNVLSLVDRLRKTAGVIVKGSSEKPEIIIRGFNTLSAGTEPLLVIDGSIYNGTIADADSVINGTQIKRIRVLKEPGEVGIYGVRGGNGVIEVTLK